MGKLLKLGNPKVHPIIELLDNMHKPKGLYPGILDFSLNKDNLYISEENIQSELWKYSDKYSNYLFEKYEKINKKPYSPIIADSIRTMKASISYSLNLWNRYKQIYRINKNIDENFIYDKDFKLYFDIFERLPFDSIFIEYSEKEKNKIKNIINDYTKITKIIGTFITFIHNNVNVIYNDGETYNFSYRNILFYDLIYDKNNITSLIPYNIREDDADGKYVSDIINSFLLPKNAKTKKDKDIIRKFRKYILLYLINAILYICSDDITTDLNNQANEIKRNMSKIKNKKITISEIGFEEKDLIIINDKDRNKYSNINKQNKSINESSSDEITIFKQKRPHWRRAHWHYYWCGEGRKELRLKFILPILVNGENVDKKISTIVRNKYLDI